MSRIKGFTEGWLAGREKVLSKPVKKKIVLKKTSKEKSHIEFILTTMKLKFEMEYVFAKGRKFRADYFVPSLNLVIEYEGLFSTKSRHTTLTGYSNDCRKYNLAASLGFRIFRYTAITYKDVFIDIQKIL